MDRRAYIDGLAGRPWSPDFHCWACVRQVQRDLFGRDLPEVPGEVALAGLRRIAETIEGHAERARWVQAPEPVDGAIALIGRASADVHCGVYLSEGVPWPGILHCDERQGVSFRALPEIRLSWGRVTWWVGS